MKLHEEFKLIENMWDESTTNAKSPKAKSPKAKKLQESRSVADIEADIAKLQAELADAKVAEQKASYGGNIPTDVWYWDIYKDPSEKGTWTSIDTDLVFETEDAAIDGAYAHLRELNDEGELEGEVDDYYVDAVKISSSKVSPEALEWSGLDHLIESKKLTEAAPTNDFFTWTIGSKSYDIHNKTELTQYIEDAAKDKLTTNAAAYAENSDEDKIWRAYYDVFNELITHYETQSFVHHQFIHRLRVLKDRYLRDLHLDSDTQKIQAKVEARANDCVNSFLQKMEKLTTFYQYNIDTPICQNSIDTIKEELTKLGMLLTKPNYIVN